MYVCVCVCVYLRVCLEQASRIEDVIWSNIGLSHARLQVCLCVYVCMYVCMYVIYTLCVEQAARIEDVIWSNIWLTLTLTLTLTLILLHQPEPHLAAFTDYVTRNANSTSFGT